MLRMVKIEGVNVLQYDANRFRVDASGALCPSGAVPQWVSVNVVELPVVEVRFASDPGTWQDFRDIMADSFAFNFWALWKRNHVVSDEFNAAVRRVATVLANAGAHWDANRYASQVSALGFHDFTFADLSAFFEEFVDVFKGERLVVVRIGNSSKGAVH